MMVSFRNRLLILFVALLGSALFISTWAVLRAVDNNARANAERELFVAERVFETLLADNSRQLTDRTVLLAEDFGFRQAIATNEIDTIISALANHGERISADMIMLMDTSGDILVGTHELGVTLSSLRQTIAQQNQPFTELAIAEQLPFQLVMVPVKAPELIAWVGVGFVIDTSLINRFREITKADVSLLYQDGAQLSLQSLSTVSNAQNRIGRSDQGFRADVQAFIESLADDDWLSSESVLLDRTSQKMTLVLSVSLQEAVAAYNNLQTQMLGIAFIVLALAVVASIVSASSVTRPIGVLVDAARRISRGDYRQHLYMQGKTEFRELGDTLNQMQVDIQEREQRITFQAQHDMVTGLPNRHFMAELFQQRVETTRSRPGEGTGFASILIKIVNFESLSDVYGITIMDRVLQLASVRLNNILHQDDTIGLIATDELLLFRDVHQEGGVEQSIGMLIESFQQPLHDHSVEFTLDIRLGAVLCPEQAMSYEAVLRRSHIALSEARFASVTYAFYEPGMEASYLRKLRVAERLQQAISEQSFTLLFQPQFDLHSQQIHSAEALIRWNDDELGVVYPDEFIPLAESSGEITLITDWVVEEALAQMTSWHQAGYTLGVSINLSAKDVLKDDFIGRIIDRIHQSSIKPSLLMFEVTESAVAEDMERALKNLSRLHETGIHLAMDDFGTGFSSLAQLKVMPVHELKIDKSFVRNLDKDGDDQKIVRSTIEMAHHLGLSVIAEGVEDKASLDILRSMHCDAIQGYFLSRAMTSEDLIAWLHEFDFRCLETAQA